MIRKAGVEYVERLVKVSHGMHQSMEAIMSSVVLESWTAFEILASDLWVAAVDNGPKEIALRVSVANRWERVDEDLFRRGLPELEYDPRKEYGRHLREIGRVSFQKLDRIIKYYSIAFENNIAALFDEVCDGYIYALSAYRNILIHHAGNADKTFVRTL